MSRSAAGHAMTPEQRKRHGVYATPAPLVSFVVRSAHLLLQSRLGRQDGLADRGVRVLDPAAGDMSFVIEAWRVALDQHRGFHGDGGSARLISEHLLPHFHGLELLAETCEEGHRAAAGFLTGQGFPLDPGQRISLLHADALSSPPADLAGGCPVIFGNPPWSGYTTHKGTWICDLLRGFVRPDGSWEEGYFRADGERLAERNLKWLQDDYVKFLRLAQWMIDRHGEGIAALVVNHNCLEAPTFRGLRQSLVRTFNEIYALDLHGNRRKAERTPEGDRDENVFLGVSQGAAVLLLVKRKGSQRRVFRADLFGRRTEKLAVLGSSDAACMDWTELPTGTPCAFRLHPGRARDEEYRCGTPLSDIFPVHSLGVVTGQDSRAVSLEREAGGAQDVEPFLVRPFDVRFLRYTRETVARPRERVMRHLRRDGNIALLALRQSGSLGPAALVTRCMAGHKVLSGYFANTVFPLYLFPEGEAAVPNLSPAFRRTLGELLGSVPPPEEILGYIYAVLYHPEYRARYRSQLRDGFPRIPHPGSADLFRVLSRLGRKLVRIHLLDDVAAPFVEPVDPEVWNYRLGSYQVLDRWLRARAGRPATPASSETLQRIAEALRRTVTIQKEIAGIGD